MAEHTPGEWLLDNNYPPSIKDGSGFVIATVEDCAVLDGWDKTFPDAQHWATTPGASRELSESEVLGNASLIRSAPDLLAAAEALVDGWGRSSHLDTEAAMRRMKRAIAKARGEDA